MKIGIIGAGFTGLAASYYLQKMGHTVTLFERDAKPGGLAIGYKEEVWDWTLEEHYHHWFTNDKSVLELAEEIKHEVIIKRPKTSSFVDGGIYQLDSPLTLLKFPKLSFTERLRTGISIALLRYNPFWKFLENFEAKPYLIKSIVSLAWFWARVYKRTSDLAYPKGGFLEFAKHLEEEIKKSGGKFHYSTNVVNLVSDKKAVISYEVGESTRKAEFDAVLVTVPMFVFTKISPQLPKSYKDKYSKLSGIGAVNLVVRLKKPFMYDKTYWLNMCDTKSPILAIVEHTNFMDKKNYNNENLIYIGNYMETTDPRYKMSKEELIKLYDPWLRKINPDYKKSAISYELFRAPFAQPIIPKHYSKNIPPLSTPLKNVYLANIQQVYPWDRGTNYAVELGKKAAESITVHA